MKKKLSIIGMTLVIANLLIVSTFVGMATKTDTNKNDSLGLRIK